MDTRELMKLTGVIATARAAGVWVVGTEPGGVTVWIDQAPRVVDSEALRALVAAVRMPAASPRHRRPAPPVRTATAARFAAQFEKKTGGGS